MPAGTDNLWRLALEKGASSKSWRAIEELVDTAEFREQLAREFPEGAAESSGLSRRNFLTLLGASAALAGAGACAEEPADRIVPYDRNPPDITPDHPLFYATSMVFEGLATGLLAKSYNGRPIKLEGNPHHPASLGRSGMYQQAALLQLYDPERARGTQLKGEPRPYEDLVEDLVRNAGKGEGLRILMEPTSSPLLQSMLRRVRDKFPEARVYFDSRFGHHREVAGLKLLTGQALMPRYAFDRAAVIVSLDADFVDATSYPPSYAFQFAAGRSDPDSGMNRLYTVESMHSITGSTGDHRFSVKPSEIRTIAAELLAAVRGTSHAGPERPWVRAIAKDLTSRGPHSVVLAGYDQPAEVHALAHAINAHLKSAAVTYAPSPILEAGESSHDLRGLVDELRRGAVQTLLILEGNLAYTGYRDLGIGDLIGAVPHSVYLGLFVNETANRCRWFVPAAHFLESWGDARAFDGTVSFVQPLLSPLFGGKTAAELLAALCGDRSPKARDLLRDSWVGRPELVGTWEENIQRGFVAGTAAPAVTPSINWEAVAPLLNRPPPGTGIEAQWKHSYTVYDGRFGNNAWLQEIPDPMTRQTWGNAAIISPATAVKLNVKSGKHLRISRGDRVTVIPALVLPGHADDAVTLPVGYGRTAAAEGIAHGVGVDTYVLWTSEVPDGIATVQVEVDNGYEDLALTQVHWTMEGRKIALSTTLEDELTHSMIRPDKEKQFSLYNAFEQHGVQWGMAVDLTLCTGCSACVVACQAENNIPVVGKENVFKSREMHWIRIDRYFGGSPSTPSVVHQPMLCQHCEKAPCEYVCPVNATTHSPDGINEMTYNRCVGTRFCSNNCPYKVRRFNWFNFNANKAPTLKMLMNPDVTVRGRGVMEKCNYCVQRIRETEILAQRERREIRDLEVQVACQQACPTNAILFGNIADHASAVSHRMSRLRTYQVLEELGTNPRTRYLVQVKNTNPEIG